MDKELIQASTDILISRSEFLLTSMQQLGYFIMTIEVIICGYILLHLKDLRNIPFLWFIFLISSTSCICGLLWRFLLNLYEYCDQSHILPYLLWKPISFDKLNKLCIFFHDSFAFLTTFLFFLIAILGSYYIIRNRKIS